MGEAKKAGIAREEEKPGELSYRRRQTNCREWGKTPGIIP
jgi:hypothetical protein